jgi:hypothetical protein
MDLEHRSGNPLVPGSNPSGPTNQPVEAPAVRKMGATNCHGSIGQLKLFSQLFEMTSSPEIVIKMENW